MDLRIIIPLVLAASASARLRYERFSGSDWGRDPADDNGHLLSRVLVRGSAELTPRLRVVGELASALVLGREGGPRPTDEDEL